MLLNKRWFVVTSVLAGLSSLSGPALSAETSYAINVKPAKVVRIKGTDLNRLILTPKAVERTGIETVRVREQKASRTVLFKGEVVAAIGSTTDR